MKEKDYLPENESQLLEWLNNFVTLFPNFGNTFGVYPAEISSLSALILSVMDDIRKGKLEEKRLKKEAMLIFLKTMILRLKKHPSYNDNLGKKLGID